MRNHDPGSALLGIGSDFYEQLKDRLRYIRQFYEAVVSQFEERKRMINENLEPYIDTRDPEDCDGPAFELEWTEANDYEHTIGFLCLSLLNKAMENYVRMFMMRELNLTTKRELSNCMESVPKGGGYTMRYLRVLENQRHPHFLWNKSPVTRSEVEDITLTRNRFMHDEQLDERCVEQDIKDFKSHSHSAFSDLRWAAVFGDDEFWDNPQPLVVTRHNLLRAIEKVSTFCAFLEGCRTT
jgi:hypothetical protein